MHVTATRPSWKGAGCGPALRVFAAVLVTMTAACSAPAPVSSTATVDEEGHADGRDPEGAPAVVSPGPLPVGDGLTDEARRDARPRMPLVTDPDWRPTPIPPED